jgi:hypothetical protein
VCRGARAPHRTRSPQLPNDDSSDDNRDDSGPLNYAPYSPKRIYRAWSRLLPAPGSDVLVEIRARGVLRLWEVFLSEDGEQF